MKKTRVGNMPFRLLKYLQPTHYFQLHTKAGKSVFPIVDEIPEHILSQLEIDVRYTSKQAQAYDLSWQAVQLGYVGKTPTYTNCECIPVQDDYHFVRKYFNPIWGFYVLVLRLLTFKNPFIEIPAWFKARNTKRSTYLNKPIKYPDWKNFYSPLIMAKPKVTIIIPTLNRYTFLKDVLKDLERQEYINFEVIVIDQSEPFQKEFYDEFQLDINLIYQKEKALWLARNTALKKSKGNLLLLFDDDSRVGADWITNHIKCLDFFNADISSGVSISMVGAEVPENYSFFRISDQLDTGNVLIKKDVFKKIGLFDRQFEKQRMGDSEFGLRAYLYGFLNISNPFAERLHLKAGTGGLREMGSWDAFRPSTFFSPRPIPSVLYYFRRYFKNSTARLALFRMVPLSVFPYQFKKNKPLLVLGIFVTILLLPIVIYQVFKSWNLASKKIKEGALISTLE